MSLGLCYIWIKRDEFKAFDDFVEEKVREDE